MAGTADSTLEIEFGNIERRALDQIRRIAPRAINQQSRPAVAEHFAVHLVRSEGFRLLFDEITDTAYRDFVPEVAREPRLAAGMRRSMVTYRSLLHVR